MKMQPFKRTKPVPPGCCPEPVLEIRYPHGMRPALWHRVWGFGWEEGRSGVYVRYHARHSSGLHGDWDPSFRMAAEHGGEIVDATLNLPWSVAPLEGKYYGTHILDADGDEVAEFWDHSIPGRPSVREIKAFGDDWSEEAWAEYCCDSHWENERDYLRACAIVRAVNATSHLEGD